MEYARKALIAQLDACEAEQAERIANLVVEKLKAAGLVPASIYTSDSLPPDTRTKQRFNRIAPLVPGARKQGRTWVVDVDAWRAFRTQRVAVVAPDIAPPGDDADELLSAAGLRPVLRVVGGR